MLKNEVVLLREENKIQSMELWEGDVKGFTNEIISNSSGPCIREISLNFLLKLSGYFFVWFAGLSFFAYGSLSWEANPIIYPFFIGAVLIMFVTEGMITPLFITENGLKKNLGSLFSIGLFVAFSTIIFFLIDNQYTREVNGGYIILISAIVYIIMKYLNRININRLARGKKNYIDDLK